jgi:hypothetical protein
MPKAKAPHPGAPTLDGKTKTAYIPDVPILLRYAKRALCIAFMVAAGLEQCAVRQQHLHVKKAQTQWRENVAVVHVRHIVRCQWLTSCEAVA